MDISSIKKSCMMKKYDYNEQKEKLLDKLGTKSSLFSIRNESNNVVATYLPYDLEFVYIPEGIYNKGFSVKERQQAREINEDIIFEETEMNVENGIFVSDILVTRTPILNSFVQKYIDFQFYEGEERYAAYLKKESVDLLCTKLNLRLPTEIEWEYFVRAGSDDLFSFGKQLPSDAELEKWLCFDFTDFSHFSVFNSFHLSVFYSLCRHEYLPRPRQTNFIATRPFSLRYGNYLCRHYHHHWHDMGKIRVGNRVDMGTASHRYVTHDAHICFLAYVCHGYRTSCRC